MKVLKSILMSAHIKFSMCRTAIVATFMLSTGSRLICEVHYQIRRSLSLAALFSSWSMSLSVAKRGQLRAAILCWRWQRAFACLELFFFSLLHLSTRFETGIFKAHCQMHHIFRRHVFCFVYVFFMDMFSTQFVHLLAVLIMALMF